MSRSALLLTVILALYFAANCAAVQDAPAKTPPDLLAKPYLYEVVRHLYRWYLDENDLERVTQSEEFVFWVRELHPKLDEDDHSRFGEILLPQLGVSVRVKRPNYAIPELNAIVKSDTFRVTNVARDSCPTTMPESCSEVRTRFTELRETLFRTRRDSRSPEGELLTRLRRAARKTILKEAAQHADNSATGTQIVHLAPLSPVANETWVFWENGRMLIRFASDIDLSDPAVWDHEELAVRVFDVEDKVVVTLDEAAGSNAFLTRDQVGRALYNCIVLGRRVELQPLDQAGPATMTQPATTSRPAE